MNRKTALVKGFTLVELLVVMAILGILTVVTLGNFQTSQIKARDAQRKSDLRQIANALEAYMNDHGGYPTSGTAPGYSTGKIEDACGCSTPPADCSWGPGSREFCDSNNTVYMKEIPDDVTAPPHYCYWSDGLSFKLYAKLENKKDPDCLLGHDVNGNCVLPASNNCDDTKYNFGISSSNTKP